MSYKKRVTDINAVFDLQAKSGLSNREIWRRFIYPKWGICERALYRILRASAEPANEIPDDQLSLFDFPEEEAK